MGITLYQSEVSANKNNPNPESDTSSIVGVKVYKINNKNND